jgi:hypothetical protein
MTNYVHLVNIKKANEKALDTAEKRWYNRAGARDSDTYRSSGTCGLVKKRRTFVSQATVTS